MIKYSDLVQYTKEHHINWNTDLFDVLRGFFEEYSSPPALSNPSIQQELIFPESEFSEPTDGEYTPKDILQLFSS